MEAVLTWLKDAGFQAVRRMPEGEFPELSGAVVAVEMCIRDRLSVCPLDAPLQKRRQCRSFPRVIRHNSDHRTRTLVPLCTSFGFAICGLSRKSSVMLSP